MGVSSILYSSTNVIAIFRTVTILVLRKMSLLYFVFVAAALTSSQQNTNSVNIPTPYFENSSIVFSPFDVYYNSSGDFAFTEGFVSDDQNPASDDQSIRPIRQTSFLGEIWSLENPFQSLHETVPVTVSLNITFRPGYYALVTRQTFSSECDNVIQIKDSRCKLNLINSKWRVFFPTGYQYRMSADTINIEKANVSNFDAIDISSQATTNCSDWFMQGNCEETRVYSDYFICSLIPRLIPGEQHIPSWAPDYYPHHSLYHCIVECPVNCTCTLFEGDLTAQCGKKTILIAIIWNSLQDGFDVRVKNVERIGLNAFISFQSKGEVTSCTLSSAQTLRILEKDAFAGFSNLSELILTYNAIEELKNHTFSHLWNLQILEIGWNKIKSLDINTFSCNPSLKKLLLQYNQIHRLQPRSFGALGLLEVLDLSNNQIHKLEPYTFVGPINLQYLLLNNNGLITIAASSFETCYAEFVETISLDINRCGISDNEHTAIKINSSQQNARCDSTKTTECQMHVVKLIDNNVTDFSFRSFEGLDNATVEIDHDWLCCFLGKSKCVVPQRAIKKTSFLTCTRLLPKSSARILIWIFVCFAFVGNATVIIWHLRSKVNTKVQRLLITNLAVSDFLMGIYMLLIASADVHFGDYFPARSDNWRRSKTCQVAATVSTISSESSIMIVTLISLDRLMGIRLTFNRLRLHSKEALVAVIVVWTVSLTLSLIPVFANLSLNYELSEVCMALPLSTKVVHTELGRSVIGNRRPEITFSISEYAMYYSIAVFIGLNSVCCLVIAICYIWIFITVKLTAHSAGRRRETKEEIRMASKMSVIVLTDLFCWVPVIIMGILVQTGIHDIPPVANAWITTLLMPINSAINPFLYTLSTALSNKYQKIKTKRRGRRD